MFNTKTKTTYNKGGVEIYESSILFKLFSKLITSSEEYFELLEIIGADAGKLDPSTLNSKKKHDSEHQENKI